MKFSLEHCFNLFMAVMAVIVLIWISQHLQIDEDFYLRMQENKKNEHYKGRVLKKYIDKKEHNTPMVVLTDTIISLENRFWDQVSEGDSIVKNKGELYTTVHSKEGKILTFDYKEYYNNLIERVKKN